MGVAAEVEAEMAVILDDIFRLRLGAQHDFVDEMLVLRALYAGENSVELRRPRHLAFGEFDAERGQKL